MGKITNKWQYKHSCKIQTTNKANNPDSRSFKSLVKDNEGAAAKSINGKRA